MDRRIGIFCVVTVLCLLLTNCGGQPPSPTDAPKTHVTPATTFPFQLRLEDADGSPAKLLDVQFVIENNPPLFGRTDSEGYVFFDVPAEFEGKTGRVIINASARYDQFERSVLIQQTTPTERITLPSANTQSPAEAIPPTQTSSSNVIYFEDFEDGEANGIFPGEEGDWLAIDTGADGWVLEVNNLTGTSTAGANIGKFSLVNGSIEYGIKFTSWDLSEDNGSGNFQLSFRVVPEEEERYLFVIRPFFGTAELFYVPTSGVWEVPIPGATYEHDFVLNQWYSVRIDVNGDTFSAYLNDSPLFTEIKDTSLPTAGPIRISVGRSTSIQLDDIKVTLFQ
jgi:hypothetical protein